MWQQCRKMSVTFTSSHFAKFIYFFVVPFMWFSRAEGSSKIHSRLEQQTNRLSQQMRSNNNSNSSSSSNKTSSNSKSPPLKEKASPASPMDDIERGNKKRHVLLQGYIHISSVFFFCAHLLQECDYFSHIPFSCMFLLIFHFVQS